MSLRTHSTLVVLLILVIAMPISVGAQGRGQGKAKSGGGADTQITATVIFRDSDRVAFRDYFVAHRIVAQPLPPGIAKKALPVELVRIAPRMPDVSYSIVGQVVVATRGGVVVDIMTGVFR